MLSPHLAVGAQKKTEDGGGSDVRAGVIRSAKGA